MSTRTADWRRHTGRIACLIALAALLAGCDKCGDWWWSIRNDPQTCRQTAPNPQ